jgi:hypothetical protein
MAATSAPASLGAVALACGAIALTMALSTAQALIGARVGSDHPVHAFLIRAIRGHGLRLFARIPGLLNTCYCAALPLYLQWILAHFRSAVVYWGERLLNPAVNAAHVSVFALLALMVVHFDGLPLGFVGLATCAFALTPQFYHALSARNFGLSARGIGLLLLTLFLLTAYLVQAGIVPAAGWPALAVLGWLIWGFSTFAQQALCIVSVILAVASRQYVPLAGTALGLAAFVAVHPRYSLSYLKYTLRFMNTYRKELAPIYILAARRSIWRDLLWDVWARASGGPGATLRYAYGNSVLVVVLLNPLCVLACWAAVSGLLPPRGLLAYAGSVTLAGAIAMILTSFRATRFLGEPERYLEAVTPWGALCAGYALFTAGQGALLAAVSAVFLLLDLAQLYASTLLFRHLNDTQSEELAALQAAVRERLPRDVRFCSNNEHYTKMLMQNDWRFAYCVAVGQDYCGMSAREAFSEFPRLRRAACQRIVTTYRINACLLDRRVFDALFDAPPAGLRSVSTAYESPRLKLLILDWAEVAA